MGTLNEVKDTFKGHFQVEPQVLAEKLSKIKAFVFDWDGVFNDGKKDEHGSSPFGEVDSMGINMLRFNHYLHTGKTPFTAILSGEKNKASFAFSLREHFNAVYYKVTNKKEALVHVCQTNNLEPHEIAFFFDDILDLSFAERCGLRIMVGRPCNPFLIEYAQRKNLADYITAADGSSNAIREATELLIGTRGLYDETIQHRAYFTAEYKAYLQMRNMPEPVFYTDVHSEIKFQLPQ